MQIGDDAKHEIGASSEYIKQKIGFTKKYSRGYWLGLIKKSGKNNFSIQRIVNKALDLPDNYNKGGYVTNQLQSK